MNETIARRAPARGFLSDNAAGMCPEALAALVAANARHAPSYGDDAVTARAVELVRELVGAPDAAVFFVLTGTAANALALATLAPAHGVVGVTPVAHVLTDECGAPGFFGGGLQLRPLPGGAGKLSPEGVRAWASLWDLHTGKPAAVSLSQATELGTAYSLAELAALRAEARALGLRVHVDGARLANAAAGLGATPAAIAGAAGADALVVGGTKNGLPGSEAVVLRDPALADAFAFRRKQSGHLASKHRFLAAPWVGVLESGAWMRHAAHANAMAARLAAGAAALGLAPVHPCAANEVFLPLTPARAAALAERGTALFTEPGWGGYRAVCAWDTTEEDVERLLQDLTEVS